MSERLSRLTTDAEQRWLTGDGPHPPSPSERLPARRAVLVPRAGTDAWIVPALRDRIVVRSGAVVLLRGRKTKTLAAPASVRRVVWLEPAVVPQDLRWPPAATGYVWLDADRPVVLRLDDWLVGDLLETTSSAVRIAGVEALAREVGAPLEVNPSGGSTALPGWRAVVLARRGFLHPLACVGSLLLGWALGLALALAGAPVAAVVVALVLLLAPAAFDVVATRRSRRLLTDALRRSKRAHRNGGATIALRPGVAGDEVVLADGTGWVGVLPGPGLGGVSSLVVVRDGDREAPWGVLVLDRDERFLAGLPARPWLAPVGGTEPGDAVLAEALATPDGIQVSSGVTARWPDNRMLSHEHPPSRGDRDAYRVGFHTSLAGLFGAGMAAGVSGHVLAVLPFAVGFLLVLAGHLLRRR